MLQNHDAREDEKNGEAESEEQGPSKEILAETENRKCDECILKNDASSVFFLMDDVRCSGLPLENASDDPPCCREILVPDNLQAVHSGEMLVVTEETSLLFALREKIRKTDNWTLRWENHFWTALASLSQNCYAGLILDLRLPSLEGKYIVDFMHEYSARSKGLRLFLAGPKTSERTKRILRQRGNIVLEGKYSIETLLKTFGLE